MLWTDKILDAHIAAYTVGNDHLLDRELLPYDCIASAAHAKMLCSIGMLTQEECAMLEQALQEIASMPDFPITQAQEDCHTAIEEYLTDKLGDAGKKIHLGRSRNDQVLTALRLYEKEALKQSIALLKSLCDAIEELAAQHTSTPMPGYTHMQKAMPTTVSAWLESFAHALKDDIALATALIGIIDKNPLGSGAGFGVPLALDREMTTQQLGFAAPLHEVYAQHSRGKLEGMTLALASSVMLTLNKFASDLILFGMFGYLEIPTEFCTGSSIMPQKKNPDVLELMRAKYHIVLGYEFQIKSLSGNLISGYHRDLQLTKQPLVESLAILTSSLHIASQIVQGVQVNESALVVAMTPELYATKEAYELVKRGMPFREAYKKVKEKYQNN